MHLKGAVQLAVVAGRVGTETVARFPLEQVAGFGLELMALFSGICKNAGAFRNKTVVMLSVCAKPLIPIEVHHTVSTCREHFWITTPEDIDIKSPIWGIAIELG